MSSDSVPCMPKYALQDPDFIWACHSQFPILHKLYSTFPVTKWATEPQPLAIWANMQTQYPAGPPEHQFTNAKMVTLPMRSSFLLPGDFFSLFLILSFMFGSLSEKCYISPSISMHVQRKETGDCVSALCCFTGTRRWDQCLTLNDREELVVHVDRGFKEGEIDSRVGTAEH